ncbi:MAG: hypothetical protein ACTHOO_10245 [Alcanivorax sp.]
MNTFKDATAPQGIQRTLAKNLLKAEIDARQLNAGEAVEVLRELFDEIEPADRTAIAKRLNTANAMDVEEFQSKIYGAEEHPKFTSALHAVMTRMSEGVENPQTRREIFSHVNYAIDDLMEDIRSNSPHVVTHPDGSPVVNNDDDDNSYDDISMN